MTQIVEFTAKHFKIVCMYIYIYFQELIRKHENYEERNEKEQK